MRVELTVSEVRQWVFCPRVLWHRRAMPQRTPETPKMRLGASAEAALEKLERRRGTKKYGLEGAHRAFGVELRSERLGVRGICDVVLMVDGPPPRVHPVDVKRTLGGAGEHHAAQLAGYAMLLEEQHGLPAGWIATGFLLLVPQGEVVPVPLGVDVRARFEAALREIREMLETERFPPPTKHRGFCPQCEYVHFCGDVL